MLYEDRGIELEYAEAQYVWDSSGRKYLDMHTGHGVAFLGHRNPHILKSLKNQLDKLMVSSTSFRVRVRDEMLEVLSKVVPNRYAYVYLLNSGSEAVEFALKVARIFTNRKKVIYFTNSFHGRTFGALSVTYNQRYRKGFEPLLPETVAVKFNDVDGVVKSVDELTAAVILELIQGEGGVNVATKEFVDEVRRRTAEVGALMIVDEVQTGFGRTGSVWAFQQYGVYPDVLIAGKAIGGGFPVSAVFLPLDVGIKLESGIHGTTYGGNPMACAAVKAATEVLISDDVPLKAREKGEKLLKLLKDRLKDVKIVREVRGVGLMVGVELRFEPSKALKDLQNKGVLALKAGATVLRLLPPYLITYEDIDYAVNSIGESLSKQLTS
ncbi:MAG: aspartate aminotransferase family protein [Zestosphaera tikiterensis]|uniref:Putative [LysW]-aminoadipate semialdehyde/glutamate semialdehyde transaminase n=1 Tax=Zestosphaera tikiterensis TaxID=1973259 RepID=A0A2R7Y358_9CREN|nr:MAG: aspartate aminotransferase family protein [Zestosphaera tikiterensis]